jgi:hypothetical protein
MSRQLTPLPSAPTSARPGSPEKVEVLRQRARLKQSLWHPHDATLVSSHPASGPSASAFEYLLNVG